MSFPLRCALALSLALSGVGARAVELAYEPVALGWSTDEVERATDDTYAAIVRRADDSAQRGCSRHCERLERIYAICNARASHLTGSAKSIRP